MGPSNLIGIMVGKLNQNSTQEVGLGWEPLRFMKSFIVTDPVHEANHTTCLSDSKSTWYPDMDKLNCESCKQFNSVLHCVASSVAFMSFDHYMKAISIFCTFYNVKIEDKNKWSLQNKCFLLWGFLFVLFVYLVSLPLYAVSVCL